MLSCKLAALGLGLSGFLLLTGLSRAATAAALDPGTPLDGTNLGGAIVVFTIAAPVTGATYSNSTVFLNGADTAVPGDIVLLIDPNGGDSPSNWAAVARFYSPSDPTGSLEINATEDIGFFPVKTAVSDATDFSKFQLFPNVIYVPETGEESGAGGLVASTYFTEFGPAGTISANQSAIIQVIVYVPEPCSIGACGIIGLGSLLRRRHA